MCVCIEIERGRGSVYRKIDSVCSENKRVGVCAEKYKE